MQIATKCEDDAHPIQIVLFLTMEKFLPSFQMRSNVNLLHTTQTKLQRQQEYRSQSYTLTKSQHIDPKPTHNLNHGV